MKSINLIGVRFGRLLVTEPSGSRRGGGTLWRVLCDCGKTAIVDGANLRYGRTKSCGCLLFEKRAKGLRLKHGYSNKTLHNIWSGMRQRCENQNSEAFKHYGGRGISVCERWQIFENFVLDMGECPPGMTIERIDNDGNYSPDNCKWASRKDQVRNRRTTIFYEHEGRKLTLIEWAEKKCIPYKTLHHRYKKGKHGADLFAPLRVKKLL